MKESRFALILAAIASVGAMYAPQRDVRSMRSGIRSTQVGRGPGWSHAQVKRRAKKARNVRRNRKAHRG